MRETSFPHPGQLAAAALVAALAALISSGQSSPAPRVTRGPYLQAAQPGSLSVAWYTDLATEGLLQWRAEGGAWRDARDPAGPALRHEVTLAAPGPGQAYEYRLFDGAGRLLVSGTSDWFGFQVPADGLRMAVFGDCGTGDSDQYAVARALARRFGAADSALVVGDVVYPRGAEGDYDAKFFAPYASLLARTVFFAALGNHDFETASGAPYLGVFSLPRNGPPGLVPETAYSFDRGGAHFVVHDSNLPAAQLMQQAGPWHVQDLRASSARFRVAALHHSPWSSAENSVTAEVTALREALTPFFARTGVDLVLAGHDHTYERTRPLDGVVYVTSGAGGYQLYPRRVVRGETAVFYNARHGFSALTVSGPVLQLEQTDVEDCRVDTLQLYKPAAEGDAWRLLPGTSTPPEGWTRPEFDDRAWRSAPAGFGFGADDLTTPLPELRGAATALFARLAFDVSSTALADEALLRLRYDDGFVAWLNGSEVARRNVPSGAGGRTPASARHAGDDYETFGLSTSLLRSGRNVLAIEVRNVAADDATLVLLPELTLVVSDPGRCP